MLLFDLPFILAEKGITNPAAFLRQAGFPPHTVSRLLNESRYRVTYDQIETLCIHLHCTPNELLRWEPPRGVDVPSGHPLQKLRRSNEKSLAAKLLKLPVEKLDKLRAFVEKLETE